jgi:Ca2+-binding EF-hand superfamily protein
VTHKVSEVNASKAIEKMKAYKESNKFTKAIRMTMNKLYTSASIEDLKATFFEFDDNKNGVLDHDEFSKVLMK